MLREFLTADFQSLSIFRILLGLLLLFDYCFNLHPFFTDFFTDGGILPLSNAAHLSFGASIAPLFIFEQPILSVIFQVVYVLGIICFTIGYRTKLANWVLLICVVLLRYRNPMILSGAEALVRLLLVWTLFLPLNRYFSVDSALSKLPRNLAVPAIFVAGIKLQIIFLYFFSGVYKLLGEAWRAGVAPAYAMQDGRLGTDVGSFVATHLSAVMLPLTWGIIIFQLVFPLLVYSPWRNAAARSIALVGGALLHGSFIFLLSIGMFPYLCLAYLALIVPDRWWDKLFASRRARLEQVTLYFEPGCAFCEKVARTLREFCLSPHTLVLSADSDRKVLALLRAQNSWVVVDGKTGNTYMKWEAVAFVLRQNPLTWILGWFTDLPFVKKIFQALYDLIGRSRPLLGRITHFLLPFETERSQSLRITQVLCSVLIVFALSSNIFNFPLVSAHVTRPKPLSVATTLTQVDQQWNLFAPNPVHYTYAYTASGQSDAESVDLLSLFATHMHIVPEGRMTFETHRWLKYYERLFDKKYKTALTTKLQALCEESRLSSAPVKSVKLEYTRTPLPQTGDHDLVGRVTTACNPGSDLSEDTVTENPALETVSQDSTE